MTDTANKQEVDSPAASVAMALLTVAAHILNGATAPVSVSRLDWPHKAMCVQLATGSGVQDWANRLGLELVASRNQFQHYVAITTTITRISGCAVQFWATESDSQHPAGRPTCSHQSEVG